VGKKEPACRYKKKKEDEKEMPGELRGG